MPKRNDETDELKKKKTKQASQAASARKVAGAAKAPASRQAPARKRSTPTGVCDSNDTPGLTAAAAKAGGAEALLRAGLKALGNVRDDVARRQSHVIESLLGLRPPGQAGFGVVPHAFPALDSLGLRKFEDVFDQRVAAALERLGIPDATEIEALREEVRLLREQLARRQPTRTRR